MKKHLKKIIIDIDARRTKAGFGGEEKPKTIFPTIIGRSKITDNMDIDEKVDVYIGNEAQTKKELLTITSPIKSRSEINWDDIEKILHHVFFNELKVDPEEYPVFLVENPLNPKMVREKNCEVMFESFRVPGYLSESRTVLSLFQSKKTTGIAVEIGELNCFFDSIYQGYSLPYSSLWFDFGGNHLSDYLLKMLKDQGYSFLSSDEKEISQDIKENLCYVAYDFDEEMEFSNQKTLSESNYELPDGKVIEIGNEKFRCAESLFKPSLIGREEIGIHEMINKVINRAFQEQRDDLFANIVVSGESSMFPGIGERIQKEISKLAPNKVINVIASPQRQYSGWLGGSILSTLPNSENSWILKDEYEENGPSFIHRKRIN
ncbi:actin-10-related [Anaeramoeba ignava]|uniref:Actin-10-related n=1 Tax=Anaeramoeba ignava TaxID=1746090 RepID=A0A9Q0RBL2_ANAIG|nr:actin-10-related [Anaeramoeba ignava]